MKTKTLSQKPYQPKPWGEGQEVLAEAFTGYDDVVGLTYETRRYVVLGPGPFERTLWVAPEADAARPVVLELLRGGRKAREISYDLRQASQALRVWTERPEMRAVTTAAPVVVLHAPAVCPLQADSDRPCVVDRTLLWMLAAYRDKPARQPQVCDCLEQAMRASADDGVLA